MSSKLLDGAGCLFGGQCGFGQPEPCHRQRLAPGEFSSEPGERLPGLVGLTQHPAEPLPGEPGNDRPPRPEGSRSGTD